MTKFRIQTVIAPTAFLLSIFALASCGGGGGKSNTPTSVAASSNSLPGSSSKSDSTSSSLSSSSSSSSSSLASIEPTAAILFPPLNAFTSGPTVQVRGTANDADGTIKSVSVNGIPAISTDGFAHWSIQLPLAAGSNTLSVVVTDNSGVSNQQSIEQKITHQVADFRQPVKMVYDKQRNRALVLDYSYNNYMPAAIIAVDLETGEQSFLPDNKVHPDEVALGWPGDMAIDVKGNRLFVLDWWSGLITIDLETGKRNRFTVSVPAGDATIDINHIAFDNTNSKLWIASSSGFYSVNSDSGVPTLIEDTVSSNTAIDIPYPNAIEVDAVNQQLIVASSGDEYNALISVDMGTGDRKIISNRSTPNATNLFSMSSQISIAPDPKNNRIFLSDSFHGVVYEVDTSSGERKLAITPLMENSIVTNPIDAFFDEAKNKLVILDYYRSSLVELDLSSKKARNLTALHLNQTHFPLTEFGPIVYDSQSDKIFAGGYTSILSINAENGERTLFAKNQVEESRSYSGIAYDSTKDALYITEGFSRSVERIDFASGGLSVISSKDTNGYTNIPLNYSSIELDEAKNQLYIIDSVAAAILRIDALSGERKIISDNKTPNANAPMAYPLAMDFDAKNNRLFVTDFSSKNIYQINVLTGEREIVSGPAFPDTNNVLMQPRAIAYDGNNELYVVDSGLHALLKIDIATGERSIISSSTIPDAANTFSTPTWLQLDMSKNMAYVVDRGKDQFLSVDLSTGKRTVLFSVYSPEQFVMDAKNNRAIIVSQSPGMINVYDFATKVLSEYNLQPTFDSIISTAIDQAMNTVITIDEDENIVAINKDTGETSQIFDGGMFDIVGKIIVDSSKKKMFLQDRNKFYELADNAVTPNLLVDLDSRAITEDIWYIADFTADLVTEELFLIGRNNKRQNVVWKFGIADQSLKVFSLGEVPAAEEEIGDLKITIDSLKNRLIVLDEIRGAVLEINLGDGSRKVLSSAQTPNAYNPILEVAEMTLDTKRNRLLIKHSNLPGLLSVDLETGERVYISR